MNNSTNSFQEILESIQKTGKFSDVKIVVGEEKKIFQSHQLILAVNSLYFKKLFYGASWKEVHDKKIPEIELPGIESSIFQLILTFIYTRKIEFFDSQVLFKILQAADYLLIDSLKEKCEQILLENLDHENFFSLFFLAKVYELKQLEKEIKKIFESRFDFFQTEKIPSDLSVFEMKRILEISLFMAPEIEIWKFFLNWWKNFAKKKDEDLKMLLKLIRFDIMNEKELGIVMESNIIPEHFFDNFKKRENINDWQNVSRRRTKKLSDDEIKVLITAADDSTEYINETIRFVKNNSIKNVDSLVVRNELPSLETMCNYDVIYTYSRFSQYKDPKIWGNRLVEYLKNGGNIVISSRNSLRLDSQYHLKGKIAKNKYLPLTISKSVTHRKSYLSKFDENHPLMENVRTFDGGIGSFHVSGVPTEDTTVVAWWDDDSPLVSFKRVPLKGVVVALNMFAVSDEVGPNCWDIKTDGGFLISNTVRFAANYFFYENKDYLQKF
ncbi:kelch-like protein [Anaeramoeba ignava]|uniref:Kelch-like protein n=1 Tax=Anaeramoeba ignava TaxID=1746090 RepID=A0A9Q0L8H4_ANAIG|nr:kelch-like protein [Anaeramoeba ignava]